MTEILLDFLTDEMIMAEEKGANPGQADAAELQHTYFIMPIRLKSGAEELLEIPLAKDQQQVWSGDSSGNSLHPILKERPFDPWFPLPLLDVATTGLEKIRGVHQKGTSIYSLPGSGYRLSFQMSGKDVSVHSEVNGRTSRIQYVDLLHAFEEFASKVREYLSHEVPELKAHPFWKEWLEQTRCVNVMRDKLALSEAEG